MRKILYQNHIDKEIDIVIYGATGFTGKLILEYLQENYADTNIKFAMAGRNLEKLKIVRDELSVSKEVPLLVADSENIDSLRKIAKSAKVVISTVGPFTLYGDALVEACVDSGTDYIDLCGEANFIRKMIDTHSAKAKEIGSRIIFSCGFDSLPSDLGVQYLQECALERYGTPAKEVRGRVQSFVGEFSGGTAESFKAPARAAMEDKSVLDHLINPFSLTPEFEGKQQPDDQAPIYDEDLDSWAGPFCMGSINRQNVHRTNFLADFPYGKDFIYSEMTATGDGEKGKRAAQDILEDNWILSDEAPKSGDGPSREVRENGHYEILFAGLTAKGEKINVSVKGDMDPGYGSTSKIISETALCLLQDNIETKGGIWTGGSAMGKVLRERLEKKSGLTFTLHS